MSKFMNLQAELLPAYPDLITKPLYVHLHRHCLRFYCGGGWRALKLTAPFITQDPRANELRVRRPPSWRQTPKINFAHHLLHHRR
jgi:hypothetical protein